MRWILRWRNWIGSCAIVAIALSALAPLLAVAKAALDNKPVAYTQICTSQGLITVALDASGGEPESTTHDDCPFCRIDTNDAPLPDIGLAFAPPLARAFAPPLFFTARDSLFSWPAHHSRGPPAHS